MANKVLGRISTVLAVNAKPLQSGLNLAKGELESFATTVKSRLSSAGTSAERALKGMYTDFQRLERAVKAANSQQLNLKVQNPRAILDVARATERIAKPVTDAQKQFSALSQTVQSALLPVLQSGQKQSENFFDAISRGVKVTDRDFANTEARINRVTEAFRRATEASQATRGLASGQELRFQNPEFLRSTGRAAQLQQQAAALSPEAISSRGIVSLVGQQKLAADEAERLRAILERTIATRNGDQEAARRAYTQQVAYLDQVNDRLERQIQLERQANQERAAAANRSFTLSRGPQEQRGLGLFGSDVGTEAERAIALARQVSARFAQLPESAQQGLRGLAGIASNVANGVEAGTSNANDLLAVLRRLQSAMADVNDGNIGASTNISYLTSLGGRAVGPRTDISQMGRSSPFFPGNGRGNPTGDFGPTLPPGFGGSSDAGLGRSIGDPQRLLDALRGSITSVKSQIEQLPAALQGGFIPAIQAAEVEFRRLAASPSATAAEIDRAAANVRNLTNDAERATSAARQFGGTFAQFRDSIDARGAAGGLEFLRTALSRATGNATLAAAAVDRLAEAYQQAANTPGGFQRNAAALRDLANDAIEATAAVNGVGQSQAALQRGFQRTGDVARGSFGNAGLAIQQAAFAVDDFFSVTGGLDQRIRAAGNNLSQLGFILGGTQGLIAGIAFSIGSQLIVGLINWYNQGRTTEDQTKALNDALARQKSLVEELAKAFESLGDSISRRAFSAPAQEARRFAKELEDIAKKQKEVRESRVASLDEAVQRERANQNSIRRELEDETDPGRRVALQRRLDESQRAEQAAAGRAFERRVSGDEVGASVEQAIRSVSRTLLGGTTGPSRAAAEREIDAQAAAARRAIPTGSSPSDILEQRQRLQALINDLSPLAEGERGFFGRGPNVVAQREVANLQRLLNALELPLQKAIDELSNQILRSSFAAALEIEGAQSDVADAIRRGAAGAATFQQNLDNLAQQMEAAQTRLRDAQQIEDPAERERQVRQAERDINSIRVRQEAIAEQSREIRLTSGRGGDRTTSALSALQGNERFANEYGRLVARLRDAADAEAAARRELDKAIASGSDADKEAARAAYEAAAANSDLAAAAAEAALAMEQAVARIRKIGADAVSQSERMADEAQQRLNERPTDANRQRRDDAERQLIADRERVARANNALDRRRSELQESDPRLMQINAELEAINQERKRLSDEAAKNGTTVSASDAQRLADREAQLLAEREQRLFSLTDAERRQQDAINQEITARRRLVDFMDEVERRRNPQGDPVRGLDLLDSPGQRAARELRQANADIASAVEQSIALAIREGRFGDIPGIQQRGREAQDRAREDALRQQAPAIFGLADSVANALLQGPSRAALQPTDISTVEGSRELTRLLRGDDAARDQANLVELQKEANRLLDLIANAPAPIAN